MTEIKKPDWSEIIDRRARVYRNLQNGTMSVLTRQRNSKGNLSWLLAGHTTDILLQDVKFYVSENGRQKVIRDRRKNVHAWAEGIVIAATAEEVATPIDVAYNPYKTGTFVKRHTTISIFGAKYLAVKSNLVFCSSDAISDKWTITGSLDKIVQKTAHSYKYINALAA
jgi:hypothetical protein